MNPTPAVTAAPAGQFLSFVLGGELYGVDILKVEEIRGWEPVRPLPHTAPYVKGVLDLRGVVVPILDLRIRFDLDPGEYRPTTVIIILSLGEGPQRQVMGIVVDSVSDVLDVSAEEVRAPPKSCHIDQPYLRGMINRQERMVVLLDSDHLFGTEELAALSQDNHDC